MSRLLFLYFNRPPSCIPWLRVTFIGARKFSNIHWDYLIPDKTTSTSGLAPECSSVNTFSVLNPANGKLLRNVPFASVAETESTISNAKGCQTSHWSSLPANDRAEIIRRWARAIEENQHALAHLITDENGKTLSDALTEVHSGIAALDWYAEEAKRTYGHFVPPLHVVARKQIVQYQPVGVVGVITPWNFPLSMITRKVGAALACGCAVVLKPAEDTPLTALAITRLAVEQAKLPPELLNVVTVPRGSDGAELIGDLFCKHPDIRLLGFTGSTAVGKMLYQKAAAHGKRVLLELGGNAPFIIFQSADIDRAVSGLVACKFRCSGQTCVSANRILVENRIYDQFLEKLSAAVSQLSIGDGTIPATRLGPLINKDAVAKVDKLVQSAKASGAKALVGGSIPSTEPYTAGSFYPATVLSDCHPDMDCVKNEIFGPVAPVIKFQSESEAVAMANATDYGLAAYVYTQDIRQAWHVSDHLQFGMIGINSPRVSSPEMPFGGIKDSGMGREGGPHSLSEFMDMKTLNWDIA